jgi:hypothetical protein
VKAHQRVKVVCNFNGASGVCGKVLGNFLFELVDVDQCTEAL